MERVRAAIVTALLGGCLLTGGVLSWFPGVALSANSTTSAQGLVYIGAYPSRTACESAGQEFVGADHFCFEDVNDGRRVWELWLSGN